MEAIDKKYLAGLRYRGSTKKNGQWMPFERPLKASDVLAWKEDEAVGDIVIVSADGSKHVVIVAADGQKHVVAKSGGPAGSNPGQQTADSQTAPSILPRDIPGGKGQ